MQWNCFFSGRRRVVSFVFVLMLTTHLAVSQTSTTGAIRGTVTDPQGAVIAGATVTITSQATAQVRVAKTGNDGQFTVGLLPPEVYKVSIGAPGFKTEEPEPVTVVVTETARVDAKLVLGSGSETVEVNTAAPLLQNENATLGTTVQAATIQELPLTNRNYTQVLTMSAGCFGRPGIVSPRWAKAAPTCT